jgi:L-fuconolactonase
MTIIDTHQHFWKYDPIEYEWIDARMAALQRDFLPADLQAELGPSGVRGTIVVQARQALEETRWLLELAEENEFILGVVGWAPIADPSFLSVLEGLQGNPKLKGLRHVVQGEAPGFLEGREFNEGISAIQPTGLVYDLLIFERQLRETIAFVDRHPKQVFVLDHIAKPRIAAAELEPWAANIAELARRENVYCKLSGMTTEANWQNWCTASLSPYVEVTLEAFGPKRLMLGSDWPVCTVACSYTKWFETMRSLLAKLSDSEQECIFSGTAIEAYGLKGI